MAASGPACPACRLTIAALGIALMAGCNRHSANAPTVAMVDGAGAVVEVVNGEPVSGNLLQAFAQSRRLELSTPQLRQRALDEVTDLVLLAQAARKAGYLDDPAFAAAAELGRLQGISAVTVRAFQNAADIDDDAVRAEYERQSSVGNKTYDFGQIDFATRDEARRAAAEVTGNTSFDQVLHAHGKDSRMARAFSKARSAQLPASILAALGSLKPGETTKEPVQLQDGWAVVHLGAVDALALAPFDQVKENIRYLLARRTSDERIARLRKEATITRVDAMPPVAAATHAMAKPAAIAPAPAKSPL